MSSAEHRSYKIRRYCRQNTHTNTQAYTRTQGDLYYKPHYFQKEKQRKEMMSCLKLMKNLVRECIGVVVNLIRIWKNEFHCTKGLLLISVKAFHCLHQPNPGEGRCVGSDCTSVSCRLSSTIRTQPYYCVIFS